MQPEASTSKCSQVTKSIRPGPLHIPHSNKKTTCLQISTVGLDSGIMDATATCKRLGMDVHMDGPLRCLNKT